jgi:hypothetical protein
MISWGEEQRSETEKGARFNNNLVFKPKELLFCCRQLPQRRKYALSDVFDVRHQWHFCNKDIVSLALKLPQKRGLSDITKRKFCIFVDLTCALHLMSDKSVRQTACVAWMHAREMTLLPPQKVAATSDKKDRHSKRHSKRTARILLARKYEKQGRDSPIVKHYS